MKDGLLVIERIIIESLAKKERNLEEIKIDTNLDHALLLNVLPMLMMKNIVCYQRGVYALHKENGFEWLTQVNQKDHVRLEAKELFTTLVNQYFHQDLASKKEEAAQLKIKKVWLTADEEVILRTHMANLEQFFSSVKQSRLLKPMREKTCEQRVVFWGLSHYSDLVEGVLKAV